MQTEPNKNYEEVDATLKELRAEHAEPRRAKTHSAAYYCFFPIVIIGKGIRHFFRRFRVPLTVKTTLIFALLFTAVMVGVIIFCIGSVRVFLTENEVAGREEFLFNLRIIAVFLTLICVAVVAALGSLASGVMLKPVRRMIQRIDRITGENMSIRLDEVDAQDELRELTKQINEMLDDLEGAFERQKKFVSDASHELKTPISIIRGHSDMLCRWGAQDPEILSESLAAISDESKNMQNIVEQLLVLARIGRYTLDPTPFNFSDEVKALRNGYQLVNPERNFTFRGEENLPVVMDKNMLVQAVRAITDNALKYSEEGTGITYIVSVLSTESAEGLVSRFVSLAIRDRGQGIAEADIPRIFDRFYRCDQSRTRKLAKGGSLSGNGLGLTITKSVIEMMGGRIEVESKLNKGSVFTLILPVGTVHADESDE